MRYRSFVYHFKTGSGIHTHTHVVGDELRVTNSDELPSWTRLEFQRCEGCQWHRTDYCPVAVRLEKPAALLGVLNSFEPIEVMVEAPERVYHKKTTAQESLSSLFGLIMATSECPAFAPFKGLAWFHLPFAAFEETLFRVISSVLLRRHLTGVATGETALMQEVKAIYDTMRIVNTGIAKRMRKGVAEYSDSPSNAVVILDSFGQLVNISVEKGMEELREIFAIPYASSPPPAPSGYPPATNTNTQA
jgi:hypothetical protein